MGIINVSPADWIRSTYERVAVDTSVVIGIRCIGPYAAGIVSVGATTGDLTFEQGATAGTAAVTTGDNPGTSGVINISDLSTVYDLYHMINLADDWEAWPVDYRPDNDIEISAGNAVYATGQGTDNDCTGDAGLLILDDTSLETAEIFPVGVTLNGPSLNIHNGDMQVLHEILQVEANVSFGGATAGIKVYECDDFAGTSVLVRTMPLVTATATTFDMDGEPIMASKGKRLVFQATDASGAITSPSISIAARSLVFGPSVNRRKQWCNY